MDSHHSRLGQDCADSITQETALRIVDVTQSVVNQINDIQIAVDVSTSIVAGMSAQTENILTRLELAEAEVQGVLQAEDLVLGCTDPEANNFDAAATLNFPGACNYVMRSCAAIKQAMPSSATGASAPSQCTLSLPKADLRPLAHLPPIRHVPDPGPSIQRWQPPGSVV